MLEKNQTENISMYGAVESKTKNNMINACSQI